MKILPYDLTKEELTGLTPLWKGGRFEDGRPMVADSVLESIQSYVSITHAWQICKNHGFLRQFLGGFHSTVSGAALVGRALTALYLPLRPDMRESFLKKGHAAGEVGDMISWPIDRLKKNDIYVADVFGKIHDGPIIGERLATAVFTNSGKGCVHNASVRDIDGILEIDGMNVFHRGMNPTHASPETIMLGGINCPMRMEDVTVMPGDVVLAKDEGVIFIPPHLTEFCALSGMVVWFRDKFSMERMRERRYTPGQIDAKWTDEIEADFLNWLSLHKNLPFTPEDMRAMEDQRMW